MSADFRPQLLLPPGVVLPPPQPLPPPEGAVTASPLVSGAARRWLGPLEVEWAPAVGGRTVWRAAAPGGSQVGAWVNRLGVADHPSPRGGQRFLEVDPLLLPLGPPPPVDAWLLGGEATEPYPAGIELAEAHVAAARRTVVAGALLRRQLQQQPGVRLAVNHPTLRHLPVLTPLPAEEVAEGLQEAGVLVEAPPSVAGLPGLTVLTVQWWHTSRQLRQLAAALSAVVAGEPPPAVDPDRRDRIAEDLPLPAASASPSIGTPSE